MRSISLSVLSVTALLGLAACGSDEKPPVTVVSAPVANPVMPTKGQQLQDIQKAYDAGVISKEEYKEQKARILD
jgi:uncharacterized lipoprotein YmbA